MKDLVVIRPYETTYGLYRDKEVKEIPWLLVLITQLEKVMVFLC